jgi:hypothetical protein
MKHFKVSVADLPSLKSGADMSLDFAIHCRQNKTQSHKSIRVKTMCAHSAVSRGRPIQ